MLEYGFSGTFALVAKIICIVAIGCVLLIAGLSVSVPFTLEGSKQHQRRRLSSIAFQHVLVLIYLY
jgi:hypothetical protein